MYENQAVLIHRLKRRHLGGGMFGGKDGGRDRQGVWDGRGHTAVFNMENQQGPAAQHGELCSISVIT